MRDMPEGLSRIRTENWIASSPAERWRTLQDIENAAAKDQGRDSRTVMPIPMEKMSQCGYYSNENPTMIFINEAHLSDEVADQGYSYDCVDTVLHEGRHAYQDDAVNGLVEHDEDETELWKMNNSEGIYSTRKDFYRYQPVEADANNYAQSEIESFHEIIGNDPGYDQYLESKSASDEAFAGYAQAVYGEDYEARIAQSVREQYAELQADQSEDESLRPCAKVDVSSAQEKESEENDRDNDYAYGMGY